MSDANPPSMTDATAQALVLGRKMWQQIERRRFSSNHPSQHPVGIRGCLDYYRGFHNLRFTSDQFAEHFKQRFNGFSDNWCLPTGSPVVIPGGVAAIETLRPGDIVYGHDGDEHTVEKLMARPVDEDIIAFRTFGSPTIRLTGNHPVWVTRRSSMRPITAKYARDEHFRCYGTGANLAYDQDVTREWLRADEVSKGDIVWSTAPRHGAGSAYSDEMLTLLGWYAAEGSVSSNGRIAFSFHAGEIDFHDEVELLLKRVCGLSHVTRVQGRGNDLQVVAYSKAWAARFAEMAGRGSDGKHLAPDVMDGVLTPFVRAAWLGDGTTCRSDLSKLRWTSVSLALATQMQALLIREGLTPAWGTSHARDRRKAYSLTVSGRDAIRMGEILDGPVKLTAFNKAPTGALVDGWIGYAVAEITREPYAGNVWDLQVADAHSFLLPGQVAVHNCGPVIDAAAERMNFIGLRLDDDTREGDDKTDQDTREADAAFQRVMEANDVPSGMSEAFTVALAASRSFGLVWGNPGDEQTPMVSFEHPEFCTLATDPDTRRTTAAAKGWLEDGKGFLTLYTADYVWKWAWSVADRDQNDPRKQPDWVPRQGGDETWPIRNPMGRVPMVEFRNQALLDDMPLSDLAGVAAMQDAINLLWAYLFNSLDFASLPQRIITGADIPVVPILDENGQVSGTRPVDLKRLMEDRILWVTGDQAKAQSWPAANLDVFGTVIEMAVDHIASQTRTPPHYLMGKMSNTAAESLTVAETGLVAKVLQRQQYFTRPIREIHELVALAQGDKAKAKQATTGKVVWQNAQYRSLAQQTDAFVKLRQAGMPLRWCIEWLGLSPADVERVMEMAEHEADVLVAPTPIKAPPGTVMPRGFSEIATSQSPTGATGEQRAAADMPSPA